MRFVLEKKVFIGITILIFLSYLGWSIMIDSTQQEKLRQVEEQLNDISLKLNRARNAQINLGKIQDKYNQDQKKLAQERTRFVSKNDLSIVTAKLKRFAAAYKLELMDFAPGLDSYFSANPNDKIISLPIDISVNGRYLDIGKFLENWHKLPFYLIAENISIERVEKDSNTLKATVSASLYTWNE